MSLKDRFGKKSGGTFGSADNSEKTSPLERYLARQSVQKETEEAEMKRSSRGQDLKSRWHAFAEKVRSDSAARSDSTPSDVPPHDQTPSPPDQPAPSEVNTEAPSPGGFLRRLVAIFIDGLILHALTWPLLRSVNAALVFAAGEQADLVSGAIGFVVVNSVTFLYFGWFYSQKGASPGKIVLGLQVIDFQKGTHLGYIRAYFRETVGKFISGVPLGLGFLLAAVRSDHRALHDLIFDSQVVKARQEGT
jgi:uncharacterized RDD family membrane protein YckC